MIEPKMIKELQEFEFEVKDCLMSVVFFTIVYYSVLKYAPRAKTTPKV